MKRSRAVQLAFVSSVPLLMTACGGPRSDERLAYQDVQQCIQDGKVGKDVCEQEYQTALQARAQQAHFSNLQDCSAQWGDQCRPYVTSSGDHWFVPAVAGFMIGRMLGHRYDPYYPNYGGGWNGGVYRGRPDRSAWDGSAPRPGMGEPMRGPTTAETLSRGGFGSSGAARASWGG
jgi:uncharacterized protein YgiB involved in biofilm formation